MLERAQTKLPDVDLSLGNADQIPHEDGQFDLVVCRYAFHHFENKPGVLDEIVRVLRNGGVFIMRNICPEKMSRWWIYHYFPETVLADKGRFWDAEKIFAALDERGFDARLEITLYIKRFGYEDLLEEAENRDASQLTMINDEAYRAGLARMRENRRSQASFPGDFALLVGRAMKSTRRNL